MGSLPPCHWLFRLCATNTTQAQNALDDVATTIERVLALLTWRDDVATSLLLCVLLVAAAAVWVVGLPALLAAAVLVDIRPPLLRDPVPPQPRLAYLPSRSDQMV